MFDMTRNQLSDPDFFPQAIFSLITVLGAVLLILMKNFLFFFFFFLFQEDYYLTPDKLWIPLRWIAPELLEEYRGSLIVTDQTKTSNVWYVCAPASSVCY